jgi:hypothetical protein
VGAVPHEFRAQHEALDAGIFAVDFLRAAGQADRLDQRALLQRLACALDLEILDQRHRIAVSEGVANCIAHFHPGSVSLLGREFGCQHPLAARLVIDVVFVGAHWGLLGCRELGAVISRDFRVARI